QDARPGLEFDQGRFRGPPRIGAGQARFKKAAAVVNLPGLFATAVQGASQTKQARNEVAKGFHDLAVELKKV
ncbi:unnamed protein product, partial [Amoebophrya sp. A120]